MDKSDHKLPLESWPLPLARALTALGVTTWRDLSAYDRRALLMLKGVGARQVDYALARMYEAGIRRDPSLFVPSFMELHERFWSPSAVLEAIAPRLGVYFFGCGRFVKIGSTRDIRLRLSNIRLANAEPVSLLAVIPTPDRDEAYAIEHDLHHRFAADRYSGEWFVGTPELVDYIRSLEHGTNAVSVSTS